jgi:hypothetical protein
VSQYPSADRELLRQRHALVERDLVLGQELVAERASEIVQGLGSRKQ